MAAAWAFGRRRVGALGEGRVRRVNARALESVPVARRVVVPVKGREIRLVMLLRWMGRR